ncbi:hypothetical protein F4780DRAFT_169745 [Xylariomycetidae sp. FL0641]|nr:hypothetical protein F4780DRAFT_169745 [Xylariomycetidae sp. FL0641]
MDPGTRYAFSQPQPRQLQGGTGTERFTRSGTLYPPPDMQPSPPYFHHASQPAAYFRREPPLRLSTWASTSALPAARGYIPQRMPPRGVSPAGTEYPMALRRVKNPVPSSADPSHGPVAPVDYRPQPTARVRTAPPVPLWQRWRPSASPDPLNSPIPDSLPLWQRGRITVGPSSAADPSHGPVAPVDYRPQPTARVRTAQPVPLWQRWRPSASPDPLNSPIPDSLPLWQRGRITVGPSSASEDRRPESTPLHTSSQKHDTGTAPNPSPVKHLAAVGDHNQVVPKRPMVFQERRAREAAKKPEQKDGLLPGQATEKATAGAMPSSGRKIAQCGKKGVSSPNENPVNESIRSGPAPSRPRKRPADDIETSPVLDTSKYGDPRLARNVSQAKDSGYFTGKQAVGRDDGLVDFNTGVATAYKSSSASSLRDTQSLSQPPAWTQTQPSSNEYQMPYTAPSSQFELDTPMSSQQTLRVFSSPSYATGGISQTTSNTIDEGVLDPQLRAGYRQPLKIDAREALELGADELVKKRLRSNSPNALDRLTCELFLKLVDEDDMYEEAFKVLQSD